MAQIGATTGVTGGVRILRPWFAAVGVKAKVSFHSENSGRVQVSLSLQRYHTYSNSDSAPRTLLTAILMGAVQGRFCWERQGERVNGKSDSGRRQPREMSTRPREPVFDRADSGYAPCHNESRGCLRTCLTVGFDEVLYRTMTKSTRRKRGENHLRTFPPLRTRGERGKRPSCSDKGQRARNRAPLSFALYLFPFNIKLDIAFLASSYRSTIRMTKRFVTRRISALLGISVVLWLCCLLVLFCVVALASCNSEHNSQERMTTFRATRRMG